jgi:hypothetical protein
MTDERRGIPPKHGGRADGDVPLETDAPGIVDLRKLARRLRRVLRGGMFPTSLASDAADAIDLLLDAVAGAAVVADAAGQEIRGLGERAALTYPRRQPATADDLTRRSLDNLSAEERDRLRLINQKLAEAEQWILRRRDQCLADYFRAGGVKDHQYGETVHEDVEIEVEIVCILRSDHPDFDDEDIDDNAVARLHWLDDIYDGSSGITNWNAFQFNEGHVLQHDDHCYLLHDLYDHVLLHEWDRILAIGAVWVDVHLIQQRETYWDRG